ncbi:MAG: UTP--glucose-1-phosphate uridylyltransferase [Patescibacteria group bacterium]|nr:UTP--glucose-1-phosphate uridylyltransferase [Patescibacteria group bacterium]
MVKIKKAVVAVAGSGTRFLPATKAMPKEMLPIVDKPIIQLVVEELVEAGIEDIILVTKWDKKSLEDHFDHSLALEHELEKSGKESRLKDVKKIASMAKYVYIRQMPQYGNGVPILSAASMVDDEPFVFCFGDDLVKSKSSFTKTMIESYEKVGKPMIAVQEMPEEVLYRYGVVAPKEGSKMKDGLIQISGIIEKPQPGEAPSNLADFGRMIFDQDIINALKETETGKGGELWIVDAITKYIDNGGEFYAKKVQDGEWLTTGDPLNFVKATLKYAVEREDIGEDIKEFIKKEIC